MSRLDRVAGPAPNGRPMSVLPRVTVLMSVRDGARHVRQAVGSILAQDYSDWEFIIIDDASTDETPLILAPMMIRASAFSQRDQSGIGEVTESRA